MSAGCRRSVPPAAAPHVVFAARFSPCRRPSRAPAEYLSSSPTPPDAPACTSQHNHRRQLLPTLPAPAMFVPHPCLPKPAATAPPVPHPRRNQLLLPNSGHSAASATHRKMLLPVPPSANANSRQTTRPEDPRPPRGRRPLACGYKPYAEMPSRLPYDTLH
ncbi:early nodulin-20-like [Cryptomeria japonica]|uniref:early nodulin-20-like n=1 Tax=Cryptomeria japonica TaxID=3369 RepID=UPI0027D9DA8A|nr:early nodulin-20-like [Cryptomeria japonica]